MQHAKALPQALLAALLICTGSGAFGVTIPFVTVADVDNEKDITGYGAVTTEYRMGTFEVTNAQYTEFLSAVAAADPNGLYNPGMKIARTGDEGSYTYSAQQGDEPVCFVSWYDALRFANWLHNGQPTGAQGPGTTEGGAYTFSGPEAVGDRNPGAKFFLPSENEWYKAAYYYGGDTPGYWEYPTQSVAPPLAVGASDGLNCANYDNAVGGVTPVGAYGTSDGYYGTFDQAGNVWEWNEELVDGHRGIRGGSWDDYDLLLNASYRDSEDPGRELEFLGFRVAAAPRDPNLEVPFRRGDVNQDKSVDISDPIQVLRHLFLGDDAPQCVTSGDANDDGKLDISDSVMVLTFLFVSGDIPMPPPFNACGVDPTPDDLTCQAFAACDLP